MTTNDSTSCLDYLNKLVDKYNDWTGITNPQAEMINST